MLGSSQEGCSFGCPCWNRACMLHKSLQTSKPQTLTQRQYNQGEAAEGHPGEGPRDGQHAVGHGGGAQHPEYDREHKRQHEHGFPTEPAASTVVGYLRDGNLVREKGLKRWNERLEEVSENIAHSAKTTWCLRVGETALDTDSAAVMGSPTGSQPAPEHQAQVLQMERAAIIKNISIYIYWAPHSTAPWKEEMPAWKFMLLAQPTPSDSCPHSSSFHHPLWTRCCSCSWGGGEHCEH